MATALTKVKGIGPATAKLLQEQGISSAEDLAAISVEQLMKTPGFSDVRARQTLTDAAAALNRPVPAPAEMEKPAKAAKGTKKEKKAELPEKKKKAKKEKKEKKEKNDKKDKKDKNKKKDKKKKKSKK